MTLPNGGDKYKRRQVGADGFQCGCRWERRSGYGDVLVECPIHSAATQASVDRFERERADTEADKEKQAQ